MEIGSFWWNEDFFQAVTMSVLLFGCTTWTLIKCLEKMLHKNAPYCFEQILEAASSKTAAVWPLSCNLQSFLLRCGMKPQEWDTHWDSNSLLKVCLYSLRTITPLEAPVVWPLSSNLTNHPSKTNKTCWALLEK